MNAKAIAYRWSDLPVDHPTDLIDRRRIMGQKMMISHVTLHRGFQVPPHSHENEQFALVMSGQIRFTLQDDDTATPRELVLGPGEVLHVPGNVVHGATVEKTSVLIDLFSPVSDSTGVDQHGKDT